MDLEKLNHWLMLAANIGVIAGIVFLGLEIRQNSEALMAGSRQDLLEADLNLLNNSILYPKLGDIENHDNLTGEDALRRNTNYIMVMRIREYAWQQYNNGVLDKKSLDSYLAPLGYVFNSNAGREFILGDTYRGDPAFKEYVIDYLGLRDETVKQQ